jgi:hypothetical protein
MNFSALQKDKYSKCQVPLQQENPQPAIAGGGSRPGPFNSNIKFVIKQVFAIFACQKLA